jgi:hypothetical protein
MNFRASSPPRQWGKSESRKGNARTDRPVAGDPIRDRMAKKAKEAKKTTKKRPALNG